MRRSLIQLYALAVCFATLMCFVVSLGIGGYDLVQIGAPEFTLPGYYSAMYHSNDEFIRSYPHYTELSQEELTSQRESSRRDAVANEQHTAIQSLIQVSIILAIDVLVFAIHWLMARRIETRGAAASQPMS